VRTKKSLKMFIENERLKTENKLLREINKHLTDIIRNEYRDSKSITTAFRKRMGMRVASVSTIRKADGVPSET